MDLSRVAPCERVDPLYAAQWKFNLPEPPLENEISEDRGQVLPGEIEAGREATPETMATRAARCFRFLDDPAVGAEQWTGAAGAGNVTPASAVRMT